MRVMLKFEIGCDPDAAWRALHSPAVLAEIYAPTMRVEPVDASQIPTSWSPGDAADVRLLGLGVIPLGTQRIRVTDSERILNGARVRILRDSGAPETGVLSALSLWDHQMAVSPVPGKPHRTLWRERLVIGGVAAPALWPGIWLTWQWRQARITAMASSWAFDGARDAPAEP